MISGWSCVPLQDKHTDRHALATSCTDYRCPANLWLICDRIREPVAGVDPAASLGNPRAGYPASPGSTRIVDESHETSALLFRFALASNLHGSKLQQRLRVSYRQPANHHLHHESAVPGCQISWSHVPL